MDAARAFVDDFAVAQRVISIARAERVRRIEEERDHDIAEEQYLLGRWEELLSRGDAVRVLVESVGYLSSSRVSMRPTNPAYHHETTPNYFVAQAVLREIATTNAAGIHAEVRSRLLQFARRATLYPTNFCPAHSCYSAYAWFAFGDSFVCVAKSGAFRGYDIVDGRVAGEYLARYNKAASVTPLPESNAEEQPAAVQFCET